MKYGGITRNLWTALYILPWTLLSLLCDDLAQDMLDVEKSPFFHLPGLPGQVHRCLSATQDAP